MSKALVPGSFDPITIGHMNIIKRATKLFDEVYVTVFINPDKTPRFSLEQRVKLIKAACQGTEKIKIDSSCGMLADYCKDNGICAVVKGVRNAKDFEYEKGMAEFNRKRNPELDTVILFSDENLSEVSSTALYQNIQNGKYESLVPPNALSIFKEFI